MGKCDCRCPEHQNLNVSIGDENDIYRMAFCVMCNNFHALENIIKCDFCKVIDENEKKEIERFHKKQKEVLEILKEYENEYYLLKEKEPNNPKLKDLEQKIINVNCALKITVRV